MNRVKLPHFLRHTNKEVQSEMQAKYRRWAREGKVVFFTNRTPAARRALDEGSISGRILNVRHIHNLPEGEGYYFEIEYGPAGKTKRCFFRRQAFKLSPNGHPPTN